MTSKKQFVAASVALMILGCAGGGTKVPLATNEPLPADVVTFASDPKDAYSAALRAVVKADLAIETKDADAGVVQTTWHNSGSYGSELMYGVVDRRIRFQIIIERGTCTLKAQVESRGGFENGDQWRSADDGVTEVERDVFQKLAGAIRADLATP